MPKGRQTGVGLGGFRAQAKQVFENSSVALAAAGADFGNIVKLNIYVLDMTNAPALREVHDDYLASSNDELCRRS
jgi:enamine deaminase RidA (YjgF/YER057c/UK114 family)